MSTSTKTEINKLIARCRRVKWDVQLNDSGGHRIINDVGRVTVVHSSYSDPNAFKWVEKELNDMGLSDRESELAAEKETAKKKTLSDQRRKADADAKKLSAQSTLTAKAAGPYAGPEVVPLDWFLQKHPAPWMRWVVIDPDLAAALLKRNVDNRPLRRTTVDYYRKVILSGHWHLTHQGMAMDVRGILQDGQHRLTACVEAGLPIDTAFFCGMRTENFKAIDENRNRSLGDLLGKDEIADANMVSSVVRLIAAYREPFPRSFMRVKTPNEVLYDAFKGDADRLVDAVKYGRRHYVEAKIVVSALSAAAYLLREANGHDNNFVTAFLKGLVTAVKGDTRLLLDEDDPRLILRKTMRQYRERGRRMHAVDQLGYVLAAWNAIVDEEQAGKKFKWLDGQDPIPQIVVCKDKGRTASAAPDKLRGEF